MSMPTLEVSKTSSVPIYKQIKSSIVQLVESGRLQPGAPIPSENELASLYEISRMTARKAIEDLAREGIVVRVPGKGTFVAQPKMLLDLGRLRSFTEEAKALERVPGARIVRQEIVEPTGQVAEILRLPEGARVVEIERVRTMDGKPASLSTSSFPASLCARLVERDLTNLSLYRLLEEQFGLRPAWARQTIGCCNAPKYVADLLEIEPGTAVLVTEREVLLQDGTPIEYLHDYTRSDLFKLRFELKR